MGSQGCFCSHSGKAGGEEALEGTAADSRAVVSLGSPRGCTPGVLQKTGFGVGGQWARGSSGTPARVPVWFCSGRSSSARPAAHVPAELRSPDAERPLRVVKCPVVAGTGNGQEASACPLPLPGPHGQAETHSPASHGAGGDPKAGTQGTYLGGEARDGLPAEPGCRMLGPVPATCGHSRALRALGRQWLSRLLRPRAEGEPGTSGRRRRTPLPFSVKPPAGGEILFLSAEVTRCLTVRRRRSLKGHSAAVGAGTPESNLRGGEQAAGSWQPSEGPTSAGPGG